MIAAREMRKSQLSGLTNGKRAVVEPARVLTEQELADRVCAYYGCAHDAQLAIPDKPA